MSQSMHNKEPATTWAPSLAADMATKAALRQEMGVESLVDTPTNDLGPVFCIDATSPLVAELLTDSHSLPAPYTNITMSDVL